ncbi:MAG: hypothetical protein M1383_01335 [Patescibacteria group bacterium]|nr:hypothetical protein [Patescibacteria group bacterium]
MSKKHKKTNIQGGPVSASLTHEGEYRIIRHDLLRVVILNLVYLAAVLAVFYSNNKSHYLENLFGKIFHI